MEDKIYQIYDKMFKKILTLSQKAVINMINGLFNANHPLDSEITYHWTETIDDQLKKTLADTIITINGRHSYHIEAQMYTDEDIVMRVFEYGFGHSIKYSRDSNVLKFPTPKIIYFGDSQNVPDTYTLILDFGEQGQFEYKVDTFKYQDYSAQDINNKKMITLIPFQLLRFKKLLKKECSMNNLIALKSLVQNDIIGSIQMNESVGNITGGDARRLVQLTKKLYGYLFSEYNIMEVVKEMDESLVLEYDHLEKKYEAIDKKQAEYEKNMAEYEKKISQQEAIIEMLTKEIEAIKKNN